MGFFWAELGKNRKEVDEWIVLSRTIGAKLYPNGIDFIDNCIIPPAIMYIDLKEYKASETTLQERITIYDTYSDNMISNIRKKHDLHRYLLDVYLEDVDFIQSKIILSLIDEEGQLYGFPDTIDSVVRNYLQNTI